MDSAEELAAEEAGWAAMGRHLRDHRLERGWTQEMLQEASGISVATIRSIENHQKGKRRTPRTLKLLSRALGLADDYLANYRKNPPADPGREPERVKAIPLPRPGLDLAARVDEIVVNRLKEIVVPRLEMVEKEVRRLADVIHDTTGREIELDIEHPDDPE